MPEVVPSETTPEVKENIDITFDANDRQKFRESIKPGMKLILPNNKNEYIIDRVMDNSFTRRDKEGKLIQNQFHTFALHGVRLVSEENNFDTMPENVKDPVIIQNAFNFRSALDELEKINLNYKDHDYVKELRKQLAEGKIQEQTVDILDEFISSMDVKDGQIILLQIRNYISENQINYNKQVQSKELRTKVDNKVKASKFRKLADDMEKTIHSKINSAIGQQNPTRRRARIAGHMYEEGERLREIQAILRGMADALDNNDLDPILNNINSKAQIESVLAFNSFRDVYMYIIVSK
jgi:hypothetical protein